MLRGESAMDRGGRAAGGRRQHGRCVADATVAREQTRGSGGSDREGAGAGERSARGSRRGREGAVACRRGKVEDDKWVRGQNCLLHLCSAINDYYTRCGVLETKSQFHDVLETKSVFMMCSTQNHSLKVCCIQISLPNLVHHCSKGENRHQNKSQ